MGYYKLLNYRLLDKSKQKEVLQQSIEENNREINWLIENQEDLFAALLEHGLFIKEGCFDPKTEEYFLSLLAINDGEDLIYKDLIPFCVKAHPRHKLVTEIQFKTTGDINDFEFAIEGMVNNGNLAPILERLLVNFEKADYKALKIALLEEEAEAAKKTMNTGSPASSSYTSTTMTELWKSDKKTDLHEDKLPKETTKTDSPTSYSYTPMAQQVMNDEKTEINEKKLLQQIITLVEEHKVRRQARKSLDEKSTLSSQAEYDAFMKIIPVIKAITEQRSAHSTPFKEVIVTLCQNLITVRPPSGKFVRRNRGDSSSNLYLLLCETINKLAMSPSVSDAKSSTPDRMLSQTR